MKRSFKNYTGRIDLWKLGKTDELLFDGETKQQRLKITNTPKSIGELSKKFDLLMGKENVDGPLKLLTNNIFNGGLPLCDKTLKDSFKKDVFFKSQFFHPSPPPYVTLCHFSWLPFSPSCQ